MRSSFQPRPALIALFVLLACPLAARAQPQGETKADPARWDVTFLVASLSAHNSADDADRYSDDWFNAVQANIVFGQQWTTHFRTEVGYSGSAQGRQYITQIVTVPGFPQPTYFTAEQFSSMRELTITGQWQFFENQWVHPFVEAGVGLDAVRTRRHSPFHTLYSGDPRLPSTQTAVIPERNEGPTTEHRVRALVGGGVKLYATPRVFFRTDARAGVSSRVDHLSLRGGIGIEF